MSEISDARRIAFLPEILKRDTLVLAAIVVAVHFVAAILGIAATRLPNNLAAIWIADAIALAILLRHPPRFWPAVLCAVLVAGTAANLAMGYGFNVSLGLTSADVIEIGAAAFACRMFCDGGTADSRAPVSYLRVQIIAAGLAPILGGALGAAVLHSLQGAVYADIWRSWWIANVVGAVLVLPIGLTISRESIRATFAGDERHRFFAVTGLTLVAVLFVLTNVPLPLVVMTLPLGAAAMWSRPLGMALICGVSLFAVIAAAFAGLIGNVDAMAGSSAVALYASAAVLMPFCISLLIEQLRREQARIGESEERFRRAVDDSAIGNALVTPDGTFIRVNRALQELLGYSAEELKSLTFQRITHPDDLAADLGYADQLLRGEIDAYRMEKRYLRKDGQPVWVLLAVSLVSDKRTGEPLYFISQIEDISARKAAEVALEESENRWHFALESARQGVWDFDVRLAHSFYSPMWKQLLGYEPDELGDAPDMWMKLIHPDDIAEVDALNRRRLAGGIDSFESEFRMRHKDGHWVWIHDRGRVIERDEAGRALRIIGTHTDITERKRQEVKVRDLSQRIQLAVKGGGVGLWELNGDTADVWWDERMQALYGVSLVDSRTTRAIWASRLHPDDRERAEREVSDAISGVRPYDTEFRVVHPSGEIRHIRAMAERSVTADGSARRLIGTNWDITETRNLTDALVAEKERLRVTLQSIGDAVISTDNDMNVTFINPVAADLTGWSPAEAMSRPLAAVYRIVSDATDAAIENPIAQCLRSLRSVSIKEGAALLGRDGSRRTISQTAAPVRSSSGEVIGAVLVFQDVTEAHELQRQLKHSAAHDALTGLANRTAFERELRIACEQVPDLHRQHALCFVDLDRFKIINDTAGHAAGDALLREIGSVIRQNVRAYDLTARLGGDEFGLLLYDCSSEQAELVARKIIDSIQMLPFAWDGRAYELGASVGIATISDASFSPTELLSQADIACYAAKSLGRNRVALYEPGASDAHRHHRDIQVAASIKGAIEEDRFRLYAQEIRSFKPTDPADRHYELLLRMEDERGEILDPVTFIPAAERYDLMGKIDRWVMTKVLRDYGGRIARDPHLSISINLSANSLSDPLLWPFLDAQFRESEMPVDRLRIEITETALINNFSVSASLITAARAAGCAIVVDDFGTGLSSFAYLKRFPVDYLKIDGSFMRHLVDNPVDRAIVESINDIGHKLGARTIAEAVEDAATIEAVREMGIDEIQGYAIAPPVPIEAILLATAGARRGRAANVA